MAKMLTARTVEAAKPDPQRRREIPDGGSGLYLVIQPSGARSWAVRYRFNGKSKKLTVGPAARVSLAEARQNAREALEAVDRGEDPAAAKQTRRGADTVAALVDHFMVRHGSKNRSAGETRRIFERDVLPVWGARKAEDIARRDVIHLLDGIVDRAPFMANRVLAAIRKLFNWAVSRDLLPASPCAGVKAPTPERSRDRILSDDEVKLFWRAAGDAGLPFGPLFRVLLLTGARLGEVGGMMRPEVDGTVWTLAAARTKTGQPHRVHLTDAALLELAKLPRIKGANFIFTTTGQTPVSGWSRAKALLDRRMAAEAAKAGATVPPWRLHDLRRTCASGMARAGVALPVIERCLNHVSGSFGGIVGVYQRHSFEAEMRDAWERWATLLAGITGEAPGNVRPIEAGRA